MKVTGQPYPSSAKGKTTRSLSVAIARPENFTELIIDGSNGCYRGYIDNGDFQVPLFKGAVPPMVLGAPDVYKCIYEELKKGATKSKGMVKKIELADGKS